MDEASIFAAAVELPSDSERKAYLDQACGTNAQLRAEVEQLLKAHAAAGSFLNQPLAGSGPSSEPSGAQETAKGTPLETLRPFLEPCNKPERIGKLGVYEVVEVVGRGGMGIVLRACDTKLNRIVAIKVMSPELATSAMAVKRFLSEAQKAAAVAHEHVVTIHAVDDVHHPPFLVMEYIEGQTLQQKIDRQGALPLASILRIGTQIAEGLAAAHARGLVHRDVKPANILLENGIERVKIVDFGLARAVDEVKATQTGCVTGTPKYMSPEQARGEPVDHRTDLFSLGSVLYAMCAGRPAFRAEGHLAVMRRVCEDTPRPIREVNPEIPECLATIIDRLLAKKPDQRYQTAGEVAALLRDHLADLQQSAKVELPSLTEQHVTSDAPRLVPRRRKIVLAIAGASAVVALALGFLWYYFFTQTEPGYQTAVGMMADDGFYPVNLERYVTCGRRDETTQADGQNNLADLMPGILQTPKVPFYIGEGRIQLSDGAAPGARESVRGIEVNRKAAKLHFLQACAYGRYWHGTEVAQYTVHYDDKTSDKIPIILGRHLLSWWRPHYWWTFPARAKITTRAQEAWAGTNPFASERGFGLRLFLYSWENPRPEKTIATIDFEYGQNRQAVPFCVAITCDDDPTPLPPEPGLLYVSIAKWSSQSPCSVSIDDAAPVPVGGPEPHVALLAPGRHALAIRDGDKELRRGEITFVAGQRKDITIQASGKPVSLPSPQIENLDEMPVTTRGETIKIQWQVDSSSASPPPLDSVP